MLKHLPGARIFRTPQKAYGTGVGQLVPSTTGWDDQSDLVDNLLITGCLTSMEVVSMVSVDLKPLNSVTEC